MIKQHCDICDGVIPVTEAYRTVNFGRGTNSNINIGYDPMVICKHCWKKMYDYIKPDNGNADERYVKSDALASIVGDILNDGGERVITDKTCSTCKFGINGLDDPNCKGCSGFNKWEALVDEES